MSSRQSSIYTMKTKVKKFVETAEPAAASFLQNTVEELSQRFDAACEKHKQKVYRIEQLKDKVEQFDKTSEKVQEFILKHSQALHEADGPGKNVNELLQQVQVHRKLNIYYFCVVYRVCVYNQLEMFFIWVCRILTQSCLNMPKTLRHYDHYQRRFPN